MSAPLPRLDPGLDELMESERNAHAPDEVLARIWSRLAEPAGPSSSQPSGRPERPSGSAAARTPWGPGITVAALVVGIGAGALLHAVLRPRPPERLVYIDHPVKAAPTPAPLPEVAPTPVTGPAPVTAPAHVPKVAPTSVPAPISSLSEERALLEQARTALADGDSLRAIALTDAYARRFPRPHFGEEREAIAIQALVVGGSYAEARGRAARFEAQSPNSLFQPVVEASLASIP